MLTLERFVNSLPRMKMAITLLLLNSHELNSNMLGKDSKANIMLDEGSKAEILMKSSDVKDIKSEIIGIISKLIYKRNWTQKSAAKVLGIDQPKISHIKNGKSMGFSLERLFKFLSLLDYQINITIVHNQSNERTNFGHNDRDKIVIVNKIAEVINKNGWNQKYAAQFLNIDQPKISHIKNGKIMGFSLERLFNFLLLLSHNVYINLQQ